MDPSGGYISQIFGAGLVSDRGYFAGLETLLKKNKIFVADVVSGTGLNEKTVRRMINKLQPSSRSSVEKVMNFLDSTGVKFNRKSAFIELEDDDDVRTRRR